jgi:hypothetical protein
LLPTKRSILTCSKRLLRENFDPEPATHGSHNAV